jgi:hypothetical protein
MVALHNDLERNPDALAKLALDHVEQGKPLQALVQLIDRVYSEDLAPMPMPASLDELGKLDDGQRRRLLSQIEAEDGPTINALSELRRPAVGESPSQLKAWARPEPPPA